MIIVIFMTIHVYMIVITLIINLLVHIINLVLNHVMVMHGQKYLRNIKQFYNAEKINNVNIIV